MSLPPPPLLPRPPGQEDSNLPIHIFDGGLGTSLESAPYNFKFSSEHTPLWSSHLLTSPDLRETLVDLHGRFVAAGADVIGTATYQGSFEGFGLTKKGGEKGLETFSRDDTAECMRSGVDIVQSAISRNTSSAAAVASTTDKKFCALSLGPLGATLIPSTEYSGVYPSELGNTPALTKWHLDRLRVFFPASGKSSNGVEDKIDVIAFETMGRTDEILAVREAMGALVAERGVDGVPAFWISCVFPREDLKLPDGSAVDDVVKALLESPSSSPALPLPSGIGINCTKIQKLPDLIKAFETSLSAQIKGNTALGLESSPTGLFHLVLYPDGAPDLVYDTVSQTWKPKVVTDTTTTTATDAGSGSKSWAEQVKQVVAETMTREQERRSTAKTGLWRGFLIGGCCKVEVDMIRELKSRLIES